MTHAATSNGTRTIISLGGSLFIPDEIDTDFIRAFRDVITSRVALGDSFVIITGGGKFCRKYQAAGRELGAGTDHDGDWIGIHMTRMNAEFMRIVFGELAHGEIVVEPLKPLVATKPVVIGAGWEPGCSSDMDAILLAKNIGSKRVINLTNVDMVFDNNPKTHPDAKPVSILSWADYRSIIPTEWSPGLNTPFDPMASKVAEENDISVIIANGAKIDNLKRILDGHPFIGTTIS